MTKKGILTLFGKKKEEINNYRSLLSLSNLKKLPKKSYVFDAI
jgi:hypothetical protein